MKTICLKYSLAAVLTGLFVLFPYSVVLSHCQVPCGIYDDGLRVEQMLEDSDTVIKATRSLADLHGKTDLQAAHQRVRWIMNKEKHAQNIIATISDYFLTQRVKSSQKDYADRLQKHHAVIVAAMKAKQSASPDAATALKKAVEVLKVFYPVHSH